MSVCQLYSYNKENYTLLNEDEDHFTSGYRIDQLPGDYIYWLNFHSLDNRQAIEKFCSNQGIDKLVIEDIYTQLRRPKLEEYSDYIFFSIRSLLPSDARDNPLIGEQLSFVLGTNFLISLQEKSSDHFIEVRDRIVSNKGNLREKGADFLLFRMLDAIIDNYFEVIDNIRDRNRKLERLISKSDDSSHLRKVELQKRKLQDLRKTVIPMKEIAVQLERTNNKLMTEENRPYFTDLKENCMVIVDDIESNLVMLDGMTNLYYAMQGQRMNEIMKVLTIVSTVFIPLTFIAGIYGMNFHNMPELRTKNGYFIAMGVMFLIAIALILFFVKRGWLKLRR